MLLKKNKSFDLKKAIVIMIFIVWFIKHLFMDFGRNDDSWFLSYANGNIVDYLLWRYSYWTSRLVIEGIMLLLLRMNKFIWYFLDTLMYVWIYISIINIFEKDKSPITNIIVAFCIMIIPLEYVGEAGWYATSLNYIWPLAFGLYVLTFIKKFYNNGKLTRGEYITFFISLVFSSNQEQMCAILLGFYGLALIVDYLLNRKINLKLLLVLGLIGIMLLFHLTCPGCNMRTILETGTWYPAYVEFDFVDKLILGILSTTSMFLNMNSFILLLFFIILTLLALKSKKCNNYFKFYSFFLMFVFYVAREMIHRDNKISIMIKRFMPSTDIVHYDKYTFIYLFIVLFIVLSIVVILYKALGLKKCLFVTIILSAAFLSRVILGFSPTVYASGYRTFLIPIVLIIFVNGYLINDIFQRMKLSEDNWKED